MIMYTYELKTDTQGFYNITDKVRRALDSSDVKDGMCVVFVPHTTAGITINENADPDVKRDLLLALDKTFANDPAFQHAEGNSAAHAKASCVGSSVTVLVEGGRLCLGAWQGIYFCEFDGPRSRAFWVKLIS